MIRFAELELRKTRLVTVFLGGFFLLSLPAAMLALQTPARPASAVLNGALLFWGYVGFPLCAALFGGFAGAGLRAEPAASAEEALPLPPSERAFASLAIAAASLTALLLLFASAIGVAGGLHPLLTDTPALLGSLFVSPLTVFHLLLVSFFFAFALSQGGVGVMAGLVTAAATAFCLFKSWSVVAEHPMLPMAGQALASLALSLAGAVWASGRVAASAVRRDRLGWAGVSLVVLAITAGPGLAAANWLLTEYRATRLTTMLSGWAESGKPENGVVLRDAEGDLRLVDKNGGETLLWKDDGLGDLHLMWAPDGTLWGLQTHYESGPGFEEDAPERTRMMDGDTYSDVINIWQSRPPAPLALVKTFTDDHSGGGLIMTASGPALVSTEYSKVDVHYLVAKLPAGTEKLKWKDVGPEIEKVALTRPLPKMTDEALIAHAALLTQPGFAKIYPTWVHGRGDENWFVTPDRRMVKMRGKELVFALALAASQKPKESSKVEAREEGVYVHDWRTLYFYDWDGRKRAIR